MYNKRVLVLYIASIVPIYLQNFYVLWMCKGQWNCVIQAAVQT